ncbi:MAG TPA: hypothetical protein VIV12_04940 [Streptosporangiaceae bacterium]
MSDRVGTLVTMAGGKETDNGSLNRILREQKLVVSRAQALACGMTLDMVRRRIREGGPWQRLLPGVYLTVTGAPTPVQKEVAALVYAGEDSVITGLAALGRHGVRVAGSERVTVLIPAPRSRKSQKFLKVWTTTRMPEYVYRDGPVRFVMPARAVADGIREIGGYRDVRAVVAAAVQQRLCGLGELSAELALGPVRGSAPLRRALAEVGCGIRSGAEGDFRDLLKGSGLPMPSFNVWLYASDGTFLGIADAWWEKAGVVVEVDSREWHLSPDDWERTLSRHRRMSACGIIVLHITPSQLQRDQVRVLADLAAALEAGRARPTLAVRACTKQPPFAK